MPKRGLGIDVLTAAQERVEWTFDNFQKIYCSFSAGKDSGVMSHMVLTEARKRYTAPICAIGGITPDNGVPLVTAGADWLAAVDGLFGDGEPAGIARRARAYRALYAAA